MSAITAIYPNSYSNSSRKSVDLSASALVLAADLARQIGMVATWPNVQTIRLAIESESHYSDVSLNQAAALIVCAANDYTVVDPQQYSFQAAALLRKSNIVNRFWFEDARWRYKNAYNRMLCALQQSKERRTA